MKKFLFTIVLIGAFAGYVYILRKHQVQTAVVLPAQNPSSSAGETLAVSDNPPRGQETQTASTTPASTTSTSTTKTTPSTTPKPNPAPTPVPAPASKPKGQYNDGTYTGSQADAYYGIVQVRATISGGKLTEVTFLSYPNDRSTSREINSQAMPYLQQEAIAAQNANVNIVSGATDTSQAFIQSLSNALAQAKA